MSTFIDGVGQCEVVDRSAELVDLKGHDITSLPKTGTFTWEHQANSPATLVGKILKAKKIFSKDDCDDERQIYYWNKCKAPYLYVMGELLDDYCASAKECAGQMRYSRDNPNQAPLLGFSIEGSELPGTRKGAVITRSIARKVTLTQSPCNAMCVAEILESPQKSQIRDSFEDIFKSEEEAITLFKSGEGVKIYETYLAKKEAEGPSQGGKPPKSPGSEYQGQGIEHGKTKGGEAAYSHGHIAPYKFNPAEHQEGGEFHEHANVMAKNPKLQENKQGRMKMNATATAAGGRRENRAALSLNDKNNIANQQGKQLMAKGELCELHKVETLPKIGIPKAPDFDSGDKQAKIGTTRSGKPVHNSFDHPAHKNFTKPDHRDAEKLHNNFKRHHGYEWNKHTARGKDASRANFWNLGRSHPDTAPGDKDSIIEARGKKIHEDHRAKAAPHDIHNEHHNAQENAHRIAQSKLAKSESLCELHKSAVPTGTQEIEGVKITKKPSAKSGRGQRHRPTTTWDANGKKYFSHPESKQNADGSLGSRVHKLYEAGEGKKIPSDVNHLTMKEGHGHTDLGHFKDHSAISNHLVEKHKEKALTKSEPKGWSRGRVDKKNDAVHWEHPAHGIVSVVKQNNGDFHVKNNGGMAGLKGVKGVFGNSKEAGKHARNYMSALSNGTVAPPPTHKELKKAIEAGSYNAAPSTLTNGAAYQTESLGSRQASTGAEDHNFQATKKKDWNKKANEEYDKWPHKEKFESFMKARLPHLHDGEIRAIGKLVSLKKSLEKGEDQNPKLGSHFLFSAENPMHPGKNELKMNHEQTLAHLKNKGFNAHEVKGHYGAPETSIMVNNVNPKQAEHLHGIASKLGQDSSIYSKGSKHEMRFHHGENAGKKVHGEGTVWHKEKPADFYTTLPNGKHFTHNFDFGKSLNKSEDASKELDEKSLKDIQKETAEKWADRAVEAYKKAIAEKSVKWLMDAIEYGHEAIEHSSLGEDLAVFEKIRAKIMPIHKEALELLAPGAAA